MEVADIKQEVRSAFQDTLVIHQGTSWMGFKAQKCPTDAWVYQELIYRLKPDFIIESGTAFGGGAKFFANMCDLVGNGHVITIENDPARPPKQLDDERITQLHGSSTDQQIIDTLKSMVADSSAIVVLDSDHSYDHVAKELTIYPQFVKKGFYLIIEDTHMKATAAAVSDFMVDNNDFIVDESCEKFVLTFNPGGFLKRIT